MESKLMEWWNDPTVIKLVTVMLGVAVIWTVVRFVQQGMMRRIHDVDSRYRAKKFGSFIGYLFTVLIIVVVYSDQLNGFTVALGVTGAGIAFALQEVIVSFAGWLTIIFGRFYKTGDRVQLGGIKGDVMDIGVLRTTIMEIGQWIDGDLYNGRIVLVANSFVFKEPVFNYSGDFTFLWDEIQVPIRLESDHVLARKVFTKVLNDICKDYAEQSEEEWTRLAFKYRVEPARVQPFVTLKFDQNWITFTLRYIVDYKLRRSTKDRIYTALLDEIAKHESIQIATSTLEVISIVRSDDDHHDPS